MRREEVVRQMVCLRLAAERSRVYWPGEELRWNGLKKRGEGCCQRGLVDWPAL